MGGCNLLGIPMLMFVSVYQLQEILIIERIRTDRIDLDQIAHHQVAARTVIVAELTTVMFDLNRTVTLHKVHFHHSLFHSNRLLPDLWRQATAVHTGMTSSIIGKERRKKDRWLLPMIRAYGI